VNRDDLLMTIDDIINEKEWWHIPDKTYLLDEEWVREYKYPSPYDAFEWWDQYTYRTPRLYFRVVIREHKLEKIESAKTEWYSKRYSVIVKGARSGVPLPIEIWEKHGTPWKLGTNMYVDCFYFGDKYKKYDELYTGKTAGTSSSLIKGFDKLEDAKEFADMWKDKAIEDHKELIEIEKEIIKLIK
jgi:hypothetical protein